MHSTEYLSSIKDKYAEKSYKNIETTIKKVEAHAKKSGKEILWADKEYYMSYEDHTFSFYNMEDILIKKYIIA